MVQPFSELFSLTGKEGPQSDVMPNVIQLAVTTGALLLFESSDSHCNMLPDKSYWFPKNLVSQLAFCSSPPSPLPGTGHSGVTWVSLQRVEEMTGGEGRGGQKYQKPGSQSPRYCSKRKPPCWAPATKHWKKEGPAGSLCAAKCWLKACPRLHHSRVQFLRGKIQGYFRKFWKNRTKAHDPYAATSAFKSERNKVCTWHLVWVGWTRVCE